MIKNWLQSFVTGGGKVINGKGWDTFGGVVGQKPNSTSFTGEWQQQAHSAKGGNLNCHWNAFSAFALSCTGTCGTTPNTVVFTTTGGSAACGNETVKIIDGGKKPDAIQVVSTVSANNVPALSLVSGNFTIHK